VSQYGRRIPTPSSFGRHVTGPEHTDYALFLDQFEFEPGRPTGEWVVNGATGAYEVNPAEGADTAFGRLIRR
jgi:hypothetical protein